MLDLEDLLGGWKGISLLMRERGKSERGVEVEKKFRPCKRANFERATHHQRLFLFSPSSSFPSNSRGAPFSGYGIGDVAWARPSPEEAAAAATTRREGEEV